MPELTSDQLGQLAKDYQKIAAGLLRYKLDHADKLSILEFQDLSSRISLIVHNSNILAALATYKTGKDISSSLDSLSESTDKLNEALKKIKKVQDVIDIAATVVNIGSGILSKDIRGVIDNIEDLAKKIA